MREFILDGCDRRMEFLEIVLAWQKEDSKLLRKVLWIYIDKKQYTFLNWKFKFRYFCCCSLDFL
jgi:hypothetical protein